MKLRHVLFWDTDPDGIDWEQHAAYVIERVAKYGTLGEWQQVLAYYGEDRVKQIVCRLHDLDPKTLNYLSIRFQIPKEAFRCYTPMPSNPEPGPGYPHWN